MSEIRPNKPSKIAALILCCSGVAGATAIAAGAYGSHGLKVHVDAAAYETYTVAVAYLLNHAVALFICGVTLLRYPNNRLLVASALLFGLGILLFCGGLMIGTATPYAAATQFAPWGGFCLIAAWLAIMASGISLLRNAYSR